MKYGMRERISGIIIIIALLVIFVPFLISDPEPRESHPQPSANVERPVDVPRHDVEDPTPPASLENSVNGSVNGSETAQQQTSGGREPASDSTVSDAGNQQEQDDPIARAAEAAEKRQVAASESAAAAGTAQGDWAVQVGSFGKPDNASGLEKRLKQQGYPAYSRNPGDGLTRVYVGPYATTEAAEGAMANLKAQLNQQGLLVRTDK